MSTPRTDSQLLKQIVCAIQLEKGSPVIEIVNADFARDLERENARLRQALEMMLERYVRLVESGDCGFWDAEIEPEVIAARAALKGE